MLRMRATASETGSPSRPTPNAASSMASISYPRPTSAYATTVSFPPTTTVAWPVASDGRAASRRASASARLRPPTSTPATVTRGRMSPWLVMPMTSEAAVRSSAAASSVPARPTSPARHEGRASRGRLSLRGRVTVVMRPMMRRSAGGRRCALTSFRRRHGRLIPLLVAATRRSAGNRGAQILTFATSMSSGPVGRYQGPLLYSPFRRAHLVRARAPRPQHRAEDSRWQGRLGPGRAPGRPPRSSAHARRCGADR
jgi:hypothetical protein